LSEYKKLTIRARKDGDIIQPLGSNGKMKLKKYLMSKKIPQYKRDNLVLLCDKNEVLWVGGVGLSDKIKTKTLSTHKIELKNKEIL
jgi:tRNA(Ile)-lysidine synthetase-like protein